MIAKAVIDISIKNQYNEAASRQKRWDPPNMALIWEKQTDRENGNDKEQKT